MIPINDPVKNPNKRPSEAPRPSKMVRDGYVGIIPKEELDTSLKSPEDKLLLILDKFQEEALEFLDSSQRDPNELADLMQVVVDWGKLNNFSFDTINKLRIDKYKKLGGFENFVVLKGEEVQEDKQEKSDER